LAPRATPITPNLAGECDGDGDGDQACACGRAGGVIQLSHRNLEERRARAFPDRRADRSIDFLVDIGASSIALRESSAARLGIYPTARDYNIKMQTANGVGRAARVQLGRVELGGITVRDVEALVVPDESLSTNLLGMTFLSRVKWTHDRGRLVLEQ
jgi:aspartyl protease family protein